VTLGTGSEFRKLCVCTGSIHVGRTTGQYLRNGRGRYHFFCREEHCYVVRPCNSIRWQDRGGWGLLAARRRQQYRLWLRVGPIPGPIGIASRRSRTASRECGLRNPGCGRRRICSEGPGRHASSGLGYSLRLPREYSLPLRPASALARYSPAKRGKSRRIPHLRLVPGKHDTSLISILPERYGCKGSGSVRKAG
jgi:hypothetical protein